MSKCDVYNAGYKGAVGASESGTRNINQTIMVVSGDE